jgi:coproporphyrinogen III oxidase
MTQDFKHMVANWFTTLQDQICTALEKTDGTGKFREDKWERAGGGGGRTRIIQDGAVIEKGGVNFSAVHGQLPDIFRKNKEFEGETFFATGVSVVLHPENPHVPIIHMNVRYFEMDEGKKAWFGGGIDLTPHYFDEEDARHFHRQMKSVCDTHHPSYYPEFKNRADDYFYIHHRQETRGIGGIFFDRLQATAEISLADRLVFVQSVGTSFAPIYTYFMLKNKGKQYSEREKQWQMLRRGRYVEFNLVYDQGTKFGLETDGRIESILMSLPKQAGWLYDFQPEPHSPEADTLAKLKKGLEWA